MLKSRTPGSRRRVRAIVSSARWSPELTQNRSRSRHGGVVGQRLDDAHEVRRSAAEPRAAELGHLGQQAVSEEEAAPPMVLPPRARSVRKWQMPLVK